MEAADREHVPQPRTCEQVARLRVDATPVPEQQCPHDAADDGREVALDASVQRAARGADHPPDGT